MYRQVFMFYVYTVKIHRLKINRSRIEKDAQTNLFGVSGGPCARADDCEPNNTK